MYRFFFFMNKGPSGRGEKEEYAEAEVVAQHVAEQADSDAENNDFRIVHRLQVFDGKTNYGTFEFPSHEKACEAGIRFCLENLI